LSLRQEKCEKVKASLFLSFAKREALAVSFSLFLIAQHFYHSTHCTTMSLTARENSNADISLFNLFGDGRGKRGLKTSIK
jgi:hypothetical protein